jgi:hypothetical protein
VLRQNTPKYVAIEKFDPMALPDDPSTVQSPISIFPDSGKLQPGCTQTVDVIFSPSIPQYEVFSSLSLFTEDFGESTINVHGIGASSHLVADTTDLNFGVLRVGTQKAFKVKLRNRGILQARYFVECHSSQYSADPEQGLLEGDASIELTIRFFPKVVGEFTTRLRILPHSAESYQLEPIIIHLKGIGSYPELVVHTKLIDFGTALFGSPNYRPIKVENKGAAEAFILFTCHHPAIKLHAGHNKEAIIPPHSTTELSIVYTPQVVEYLDVKVFLRSSDSRGDYFMVQLKGSVGVPKLIFDPPNILDSLDFGVCAISRQYKKTFTMRNEGNIKLTYKFSVSCVSVLTESKTPAKSAPRRPIIIIEPEKGSLAIGEIQTINVSFIPEMLAEYHYKVQLEYDFRTISASLKGIGGCAILHTDTPLKLVDFGTCRMNRVSRKSVTITNTGNLGVQFHVRTEGSMRNWDLADMNSEVTSLHEHALAQNLQDQSWVTELALLGFKVVNPDGFCKPNSKTDLVIEYKPVIESFVSARIKIFFGADSEEIEIRGRASTPRLQILSTTNDSIAGQTLDLGVHPVNSEHIHVLQLHNQGSFGVDFLVQPVGVREFEIYPMRGFIEPETAAPLKIYFRPNSENRYQMTLKILWELEPLEVNLVGSGGIGKLEVGYIDEKDVNLKGLDFGMIPFNSTAEKRFFLYNIGLVPISVFAEVDCDDYAITQLGDPFIYQKQGLNLKAANKRTVWNWHNELKIVLPPSMGVEFAARFMARTATVTAGAIAIRSECRDFLIPLRGKGGTISISHKGDLSFGDIASNFTYSRRITIVNTGSIPSQLTLEWLVVGHSTEPTTCHVKLGETFSSLDPRSGWARISLLKERGVTDYSTKLTASDYWRMISKIIRKIDNSDSDQTHSRTWTSRSKLSREGLVRSPSTENNRDGPNQPSDLQTGPLLNSGTGLLMAMGTDTRSRLMSSSNSYSILHGKKSAQHYSTLFKRRQMLFHLISSSQLTSQSSAMVRPFLKVEPGTCALPSYGEVNVNVDICLNTEDTFLATLLVKPNVPNTPTYEIPLTATPKAVYIICDDTRMLNFYRQPMGESEVLTRSFTNVGHKDVNFRIVNTNPGLTIVPSKGVLKMGQAITVQFIFRPLDESVQSADIIFEPDCSQSIRLKMNGAGGFAKASLARYRRFDFGHCMIGKDTVSLLPITNEGNAILHLTRFQLHESDTFFKGVDWPTSRVSLFPSQTFNLAIVFNPREESPAPGRLVIGTNTDTWEIELIGLGREAVLIVSKVSLEFTECLIGNSYERKLGLKNVGDVNYPVTFKLEKECSDIEFIPASLVINPFSESSVIVSYSPTSATKMSVTMVVSSPYSTHKVPLILHAGTATLEFSSEELDFGMFERVSRPTVKLLIKNTGTVKTSYSVRDVAKPSMFQLANAKGLLHPGKATEVSITYIRHEVCQFHERLIVRSDLIDTYYHIDVTGQCEEALLKPEEFSLLNMGICPVLEVTTKELNFTNYGRYPLQYSVKSAYPLKVSPTFGTVAGGETAAVNVSWNPSGGYELRTQLTIVTNIGNYNVTIRGKAAFPELAIKNMYIGKLQEMYHVLTCE